MTTDSSTTASNGRTDDSQDQEMTAGYILNRTGESKMEIPVHHAMGERSDHARPLPDEDDDPAPGL
jgi:hypothetical protein